MDLCTPTIWFPREIDARKRASLKIDEWRIRYTVAVKAVGLGRSKMPDDPSSEKG